MITLKVNKPLQRQKKKEQIDVISTTILMILHFEICSMPVTTKNAGNLL